jgi:F-type H+-transporting ATPase subunit a
VVPIGEIIWKPFDMGIGVIQAFIFTLLTMLYMGMAMSHHGSDEHADSSH